MDLRRSLLRLAPLLLALALLAPASARAQAQPPAAALTCQTLPNLLRAFLKQHVRYHQLDGEIRSRAIDSYLQRVDPSKTLLLQSEAEALRSSLGNVFDEIRAGNCGRLLEIHQGTVRRYQEAESFARSLLEREDFALDPEVRLVIDPDERGFPKTSEERRKLQTSVIHFQVSNYLSAGTPLAEAKGLLIHRYELMTKRAGEQKVEDLYAGFLDSFASSLDPHSNYLSPDVLEDFRIGMALSLEGIGVALSSQDGYSVVESIVPGGAADRDQSLRPKDKIVAVAQDGGEPVNVIDMDLRDVVRMIRGKKGTKVHLTVLRQSAQTERLNVTIVRDKIDLEEQAAKLRFEERELNGHKLKLAVLELPSFYGDKDESKRRGSEDVKRLLREVEQQKADGLLLDISRNGGGLLDDAVSISGFFVQRGGIVAVESSSTERQILPDPDDGILYSGPMVVLTSRVSASASEILAGALKDYRRAVIVGDDRTFGKGSVQTVMPLPTGLGALKITTALFFLPAGESTQHSGVKTDIVIPSLFDSDDFGERKQRYSLPPQQIDPFLSTAELDRNGRAWTPVTSSIVERLAAQSKQRVAQSEEFQEIGQKLKEAKQKQGVIHLAELLKEQEKAKQETPEAAPQEKPKEPPSPQLVEALNILADYVVMTQVAMNP